MGAWHAVEGARVGADYGVGLLFGVRWRAASLER